MLDTFDYESFKSEMLGFLNSMSCDESGIKYRYSKYCTKPTLYSSAYACMILSMLGVLSNLNQDQKNKWVEYFDSFQNPDNGLFYDPVVMNDIYPDTDWWGARHLALHMIIAYTDLDAKPKYPFFFLNDYYKPDHIKNWLDEFDWKNDAIGQVDIDNKIMNIGCLLQYQRDIWGDKKAGCAIESMKKVLIDKINPETGMWGGFNIQDKYQRSRMVQFAYHLFPIFFYDGYCKFDIERIVTLVLQTQNRFGGYGVKLNSSACDDIDSIDLLLCLSSHTNPQQRKEIDRSVKKSFDWVHLNQVQDGGFVFRLREPFKYGHSEMDSKIDQGAMFPTWFRLLSIAKTYNHLMSNKSFLINRTPGYLAI